MAKTKAKQGNASIEMNRDMTDFFLGALKTILPNAEKIMRESLDQIEKEAKESWPKKKPRRTYDKRTGQWTTKDESRESYKQFERGVRIEENGSLVVFLKNTAEYSWAIKFGQDSRNKDGSPILQPQGRRAANELLVKPMNKSSRKVVKALADDMARRL